VHALEMLGVEDKIAHFCAIVSKGTYIRSLGRDIAHALGSEGYISRLHRAAVGPFTDRHAISLDFLSSFVHKAPPPEGNSQWLTPLERALDDIPALTINGGQLQTLRHGQRVTLASHHPDTAQLALLYQGQLVGMARVEGNQVISNRLLNVGV
jgi:tRNA pseudouridine55 synthase